MSLYELIFLSAGLAMDATAVLFCLSLILPQAKRRLLFKAAFYFGALHWILPGLGYLAGLEFNRFIASIDHWIAFVLLVIVGSKMIAESDDNPAIDNLFSSKNLLLLGLATSIDSLVVGVTFSFIELNLLLSMTTIALTAFSLSLAAGMLARRFSGFNPKYLRIAGGSAIILIGLKTLIEHFV